jgi:hypothetical protein
MKRNKLQNILLEAADIFYLFSCLVCFILIALHQLESVDTGFEGIARLVETIKADHFAFLNGGEGYEPADFSNFKRLIKWLIWS